MQAAAAAMAAEAHHDSADDGALRDRFFGDPVQVPALALVRPIYRSIYQGACMKELLAASGTDAAALGLDHDCGIGYGETSLEAIWRILRKVDLRSYEPAGASVLDCGSGVGNVVVAVALLAAAGECCGGRVARVEGVELLPSLHALAASAVGELRYVMQERRPAGVQLLPLALPACTVSCGDLLAVDLRRVDVVYMTTTLFNATLLEHFARRAAEQMRPGSRVVTLTRLAHAAYEVEARVPIGTSWGDEEALVHVLKAGDQREVGAGDEESGVQRAATAERRAAPLRAWALLDTPLGRWGEGEGEGEEGLEAAAAEEEDPAWRGLRGSVFLSDPSDLGLVYEFDPRRPGMPVRVHYVQEEAVDGGGGKRLLLRHAHVQGRYRYNLLTAEAGLHAGLHDDALELGAAEERAAPWKGRSAGRWCDEQHGALWRRLAVATRPPPRLRARGGRWEVEVRPIGLLDLRSISASISASASLQVLYINLTSRPERRDALLAQCACVSGEVTPRRFAGVVPDMARLDAFLEELAAPPPHADVRPPPPGPCCNTLAPLPRASTPATTAHRRPTPLPPSPGATLARAAKARLPRLRPLAPAAAAPAAARGGGARRRRAAPAARPRGRRPLPSALPRGAGARDRPRRAPPLRLGGHPPRLLARLAQGPGGRRRRRAALPRACLPPAPRPVEEAPVEEAPWPCC